MLFRSRAATFAGYVRQCARGWAGINLGAFTPRDSAFDVEDVRVALGVERINLVGYGSGTRVAMDYLRLYPNRAEQAVLVGAAAPSQVDALPADGEAALDRIATAIATDVNVGPKFPDLRTALVLLLDEVERVLDIACAPITWPIGMGRTLKGVYHLGQDRIYLYRPAERGRAGQTVAIEGLESDEAREAIGDDLEAFQIGRAHV